MNEMARHVESLLKNYPGMKQQLKALEYELAGLQKTLDPGLIEGKVLSRSGIDRVSGAQPRDQTADIVVEHVDRQRNAKYHALKSVICTMDHEIRRLDYYLSLLTYDEADVLRRFYFEGLSWTGIAQKTSLTVRSMQRRRKCGFDRLVGFYSALENLPLTANGAPMNVRFIGYLHEERYAQCLTRMAGTLRTPGTEAMLYIISGCNELWNAGADAFLNFETWETVPQDAMMESFSAQGAKLLRLAYCCAQEIDIHRLPHIIDSYFPGLEHVHLELAIEAIRLAAFTNL